MLLSLARIYALAGAVLPAALVILQVIDDGEGLSAFTTEELILFALFPVGVVLGLTFGGLLWPRTGGWIATLCLVGFYVGMWLIRDELPRGPYFLLFASGGPVLLIAALFSPRR